MRRYRRLILNDLSTLFTLSIISALLDKGLKKSNGEQKKEETMSTKKDLEFIKDYAERMNRHPFVDSKQHLLDMLDWLIAYYENRASCTPKEYLEVLINSQNLDGDIFNSERVRLLYNWINYKTIVGF
jgi:hypothetical protein